MTNNYCLVVRLGCRKSERQSLNLNFNTLLPKICQLVSVSLPQRGCLGNDHPGLTVNSQQIVAILGEAQRLEFNCPLHVHFPHIYFHLSVSQLKRRLIHGSQMFFRLFC